jgi:alpha-L-rhamnosidase
VIASLAMTTMSKVCRTASVALVAMSMGSARGLAEDGPGAPTGLTVELLRFPERAVITDLKPELGWIVEDPRRRAVQTAYQIRVASSRARLAEGDPDLWDSGRTLGDASRNVEYGGKPLGVGGAYVWQVRTWDGDGQASPWSEAQEFHTTPSSLPEPQFPGQSRWVDLGGEPVLEDRQRPEYVSVDPVSVTDPDPGRTFADFGKAAFGTLAFRASAPTDGATLTVYLGERRDGEAVHKRPGTTNIGFAKVEMDLRPEDHTYQVELPRHRARYPHSQQLPEHMPEVVPFRYAELVAGADGVALSGIEQRALFYPFDDDASHFESSDERLNRVWNLCKHTLKATPFLALYADGNRERMPYEADAFIQQLGHYAVDREYAIARYTNQFLIWNPSWPTEWQMHTVFMAHAHWMQTGDTEHLARNYDHLKAKTLLALAREDGLISTRTGLVTPAVLESLHHVSNRPDIMTDIVDWPPGAPEDGEEAATYRSNTPEGERDGYVFADINTVVNAFHYRSLRMMAQIAGALGKEGDREALLARARKVRASFNEKLFDPERGVYVDGEGVRHASLHANMFPLAFGLVPPGRLEGVVRHIESRGMACSVYGAQYLLEALYAAGEAEYALSLMTSDSKRSWLNMLRVGATMTTEAWDEFYKPNLTWNHAWGSAPANIVARKIAGIEPAAPGFTRIAIAPQLSGLEQGDLKMPTPRGAVRVAWTTDDDGLSFDVTVPANTRAEIVLPPDRSGGLVTESGRPLDAAPGVEVRRRRGKRAVVEVGGGTYRFRLR